MPVTGRADRATIAALNRGAAHYERLILANIERARAIPAAPGGRYILVDTASARLWMVEDGRIAGPMRVIVGKRAMPTPADGRPDPLRRAQSLLEPAARSDPRARPQRRCAARAIAAERLQVLSDWSAAGAPCSIRGGSTGARSPPAGASSTCARRPGPHNMMGRIKFMLPNDLGVYLHDTPHRDLFAGADRRAELGLRPARGRAAARALAVRRPRCRAPSGAPEQRVDLPEPVPVYITYLTALPTRDGVVFQRDAYSRDVSRGVSAASRSPRQTRSACTVSGTSWTRSSCAPCSARLEREAPASRQPLVRRRLVRQRADRPLAAGAEHDRAAEPVQQGEAVHQLRDCAGRSCRSRSPDRR